MPERGGSGGSSGGTPGIGGDDDPPEEPITTNDFSPGGNPIIGIGIPKGAGGRMGGGPTP